ncbi:MAG: hypothetical protein RLZZ15_1106 [Verrucomicrobiota bacterium]|jgi:hypothetical protein
MKKPLRLLLLALGVAVVLVLIAGGLALHSGVQTWAARRALAAQPGMKARLGQLSAGFRTVELADLHFEQDGATITLPSLRAELSVVDAGLNQKVRVRRLVARGWTLDLSRYATGVPIRRTVLTPPPGGRAREFSFLPSAYAAAATPGAAATAVARVFEGVFAGTVLPMELTLDGVELEGDVILPPASGATGRAHITITGGGFAAGREGALDVAVTVALTGADLPVNAVTIRSRLTAAMDTPRTFTRLAAKSEAAATGPQFPRGVRLAAESIAARDAAGENYALNLSGDGRPLVAVRATWPKASRRLDGTWKLDLADADLAPFALGVALPIFTATGAGRFDSDPMTGETRAAGKLDATADKLAALRPELAAVGAVKLAAEFDLARRGDVTRVERLALALAGAQPVLRAESLQPFALNARTGALDAADPARPLLALTLEDVPLAWAGPWLGDLAVSGGGLRGELVATAHAGGVTLRPKRPLTAGGVALTQSGRSVLHAVEVALAVAADYTPQGWQVELAPLTLTSAGKNLISLDARAGRLAGRDQPLKATGKFFAHVPAVLAQPLAGGASGLTRGELAGSFVATLDAQDDVEASFALTDLAADPKLPAAEWPTLNASVRATFAPKGGPISLRVPLLLERGGRKSDLIVTGTVLSTAGVTNLNAQLAGNLLVVEDALPLLAFASNAPPTTDAKSSLATAPAAPATLPPWAGWSGQISFALKKILYADAFAASDVSGALRLDAGVVQLERVRAGLGDGGEAKVSGRLGFDAKSPAPFTWAADLAISEFNPASLFRALNPGRPPTVEGRFAVASKLAGQSPTLAELAATARGDFQLTSKGGVFRGLPVGVASKVESVGKLAAGAAKVGSLISAVTGKKETAIANRAQAVAEISQLFSPIAYDQLSVVLGRDAALNTVVKDFTLIAPEVRLSGGGEVAHRPGTKLLAQALAMEFTLRARGHTAELLKYLDRLDAAPDELGYAACTLPLRIGGTLDQPDASEIARALTALAVEKSGATELFNKLIGGGK